MTISSWVIILVFTCTFTASQGYRVSPVSLPKILPSSSSYLGFDECQQRHAHSSLTSLRMSSYFDELSSSKSEKRCLVGFTTDAWNVGQKKVSRRTRAVLRFEMIIEVPFNFQIHDNHQLLRLCFVLLLIIVQGFLGRV